MSLLGLQFAEMFLRWEHATVSFPRHALLTVAEQHALDSDEIFLVQRAVRLLTHCPDVSDWERRVLWSIWFFLYVATELYDETEFDHRRRNDEFEYTMSMDRRDVTTWDGLTPFIEFRTFGAAASYIHDIQELLNTNGYHATELATWLQTGYDVLRRQGQQLEIEAAVVAFQRCLAPPPVNIGE